MTRLVIRKCAYSLCSMLASMSASAAALVACTGDGDRPQPSAQRENASVGIVALPLELIAESGAVYYLAGEFRIDGETELSLTTDEYADESQVVQALPTGSYTITLKGDWELLRETEDGYVPATGATLLSSQTQDFAIEESQVTEVVFAFQVQGETASAGGTLRLSATVQEASANGGAGGSPDPGTCSAEGLVAHYAFDDSFADLCPDALDGSASGQSSFAADRCGREASAYELNGSDSYVDLGTSLLLKPAEEVTVAAWIQPITYEPVYQNIISDHAPNEGAVDYAYALRFAGSELQFLVGGVYGAGKGHYASVDFPAERLGVWSHAAGTYDGQTIRLYVDGVLVDSSPHDEPITQNANPVWVGNSGYVEFFEGLIDDLRIYNRSLAYEEISYLALMEGC